MKRTRTLRTVSVAAALSASMLALTSCSSGGVFGNPSEPVPASVAFKDKSVWFNSERSTLVFFDGNGKALELEAPKKVAKFAQFVAFVKQEGASGAFEKLLKEAAAEHEKNFKSYVKMLEKALPEFIAERSDDYEESIEGYQEEVDEECSGSSAGSFYCISKKKYLQKEQEDYENFKSETVPAYKKALKALKYTPPKFSKAVLKAEVSDLGDAVESEYLIVKFFPLKPTDDITIPIYDDEPSKYVFSGSSVDEHSMHLYSFYGARPIGELFFSGFSLDDDNPDDVLGVPVGENHAGFVYDAPDTKGLILE